LTKIVTNVFLTFTSQKHNIFFWKRTFHIGKAHISPTLSSQFLLIKTICHNSFDFTKVVIFLKKYISHWKKNVLPSLKKKSNIIKTKSQEREDNYIRYLAFAKK